MGSSAALAARSESRARFWDSMRAERAAGLVGESSAAVGAQVSHGGAYDKRDAHRYESGERSTYGACHISGVTRTSCCVSSQDEGESVVLEGVVVKVRKASRTLAFLSVRAETPGAAAGHLGEDRSQVVQAVLEHEAGWRWACGEDGRRVCCGAVLSLWGDLERDVSPGSAPSLLVRGGLVRSSPHDSISAAGGVKQHAEVERAAAAAAACTPHCVRVRGDAGTGGQRQRSGLPLPLCKQWWKARVDGTVCVCATRGSDACPDDEEEREAGVIGACGRRHYFASAEEDEKYRLLEEKRQRSRELERSGILDDPHSACSKLKKAHSDGLFVDWLLVSLPLSLSPSPSLPSFSSSIPLSVPPSPAPFLRPYMHTCKYLCVNACIRVCM